MADVKELPADATERRANFARQSLNRIIETKSGNEKVFGETAVILHWNHGVLVRIELKDSSEYR